jgi:mono/diheme cytochrome c family protein
MKVVQHIAIITMLVIGLASCSEYSKKTGTVYMPDMSYSRAYEFYSNNPNYADSITAQAPVKGTISRGALLPDHLLEDDSNGYKALKYDGTFTAAQVEEGGRLYTIHCGVCHGNDMGGNGPLYNGGAGKYPAAPANFKDAKYLNMPVGTMYHAIMYGKNLMGAYSSQLDGKQRWAVLAYMKKIQADNGGAPLSNYFTISETATKSAVTDSAHATEAHSAETHAATSSTIMHTATKEAITATVTKTTTVADAATDEATKRRMKALENKAVEQKHK